MALRPRCARLVGPLVLAALVVGACGGDDAGRPAGPSTTAPTPSTPPTVTATSTTADPTTSAETTSTSVAVTTTTGAPTTTPGGAAPSTAPNGAPTTAPADPVPDGTSFGYLRGIDVGGSTITIDIAELLDGDAAVRAAIEDGVLPPGETSIDNDYYIRNRNPKVRTAPVGRGAAVRLLSDSGSPSTVVRNLSALAEHVAERGTAEGAVPVRIVALGGVVSRIDEVFFP